MKTKGQTKDKKSVLIIILFLVGFCAMQIPGVFFFGRISEPFLFGMPFIYGYILCLWVYMCIIFLYAHKCDWGRKRNQHTKADDD
jgi:uncharacterized membrane protein